MRPEPSSLPRGGRSRRLLSFCLVVFGLPGYALADQNVTTNRGTTSPGYSIEYGEATPRPGTRLRVGDTVYFRVRFRYTLQSADNGRVTLAFRDEKSTPVLTDREVGLAIARGTSKTATLSQNAIVPAGVQTLFLFIPVVPDDLKGTTEASLVIRYPIATKR